MAKKIASFSLLLLVTLLVGCDHATKQAASTMLSPRSTVELVPGFLDLTYTRNYHTAFSVTRRLGIEGGAVGITILAAAVLVGLSVWWWRRRHEASRLEHVGYAFAMAGAIGNVADRIVRGFVVDFIHVHHWPIFNVADVSVVIGMGLIFLSGLKRQASEPS